MRVRQLLHTLLKKSLPVAVHAKRLNAVIKATHSLTLGKRLTLTQLARDLPGKAKERHNIRGMDRLLGNKQLHGELKLFYQAIMSHVITPNKRLVINVDWSTTDRRKDWHILRASVAIKGRSLAIYQEVHPQKYYNNAQVHKEFLQKLKVLLPNDIRPIIITDAGFCNPWFIAVQELGYDFIGRTKSTIAFKAENSPEWFKCSDLYGKASSKPLEILNATLTKDTRLSCRIVVIKEKQKGRIMKNRSGKKCINTASNRVAKRQKTPWVLISSLNEEEYKSSQIVKLYKKRMQIEEDFRDTKSTKYGFSLRYSLTKSSIRMEVLLLFAALASFACWIISLNAYRKNQQFDFQANTYKHREVLSAIYLGCQIIRRGGTILLKEVEIAIRQLQSLVMKATI